MLVREEKFFQVDLQPLIDESEKLTLHEKELTYQYPSQSIMDMYYEWAQQFQDEGAWKSAQESPEFEQEWYKYIRYESYNRGKVLGIYRLHNWMKSKFLSELCDSAISSYNNRSIFSTTILCRAIIEQSSSIFASCDALEKLFQAQMNKASLDDFEWLIDLEHEIRNWTHATRINWADYIEKGLKVGSRGSFSEEKNHFGRPAVNLMPNIDKLSKAVKGARKAYEFASEFSHPNYGPYGLFLSSAICENGPRDVKIWTRVYNGKNDEQVHEAYADLLNEFIRVCAECVSFAREELDKTATNDSVVKVSVRRCVKRLIKSQRNAFKASELCPCFSGKAVRACCGR